MSTQPAVKRATFTLPRFLVDRRTYSNVVFLATRPLVGTFYFVLLVVGVSVGLGLSVIIIGIPILVLTVLASGYLSVFERELTQWWLGVRINPMTIPSTRPRGTWLNWLGERLNNPVTWKSLAYLTLQLPAGAVFFWLFVTGIGLGVGLILNPFVYADIAANPSADTVYSGFIPDLGAATGLQHVSAVFPIAGAALIVLCLYGANLVAALWGEVARALLGMSDAKLALIEAQQRVRVEQQRADVSDIRRAELVVNVSHELRTPIASIRGHVDTLRMPDDQRPPDVDENQYLDVISREVDRLSALVDDLLIAARGESGDLKLDVVRVDPLEVIDSVEQALGPIASRHRKVTLVVSAPPSVPQVEADAARLRQVLMNLVRNAITFTPEGGVISMQVKSDAQWVTITVEDTGVGNVD